MGRNYLIHIIIFVFSSYQIIANENKLNIDSISSITYEAWFPLPSSGENRKTKVILDRSSKGWHVSVEIIPKGTKIFETKILEPNEEWIIKIILYFHKDLTSNDKEFISASNGDREGLHEVIKIKTNTSDEYIYQYLDLPVNRLYSTKYPTRYLEIANSIFTILQILIEKKYTENRKIGDQDILNVFFREISDPWKELRESQGQK